MSGKRGFTLFERISLMSLRGKITVIAIAVILVIAGLTGTYMAFTSDKKPKEVSSEEVVEQKEEYANVGDAVLVSNNEIQSEEKEEKVEKENIDVANQEVKEAIHTPKLPFALRYHKKNLALCRARFFIYYCIRCNDD